jgi:hypothetical protein
MGLGVSLFLIAVGAILTWAVDVHTQGINLNTVGVILMVIGAVGLVLSLLFWTTWGGRFGSRRREVVVEDHDVAESAPYGHQRRVIRQDEQV